MLNKSTKDIKYMIGIPEHHKKVFCRNIHLIVMKTQQNYIVSIDNHIMTTDNKTTDVKWTKSDCQHYQHHIVDKSVYAN